MEISDAWLAYLIPAVVACLGAIGAAVGFLARKLWIGASYYADKVWQLAERSANKHFEFVDGISSSMMEQNELLSEIKVETSRAANVIDTLGSDPTGVIKIQELIDLIKAQAPFACKYSDEELRRQVSTILSLKAKTAIKPSKEHG